MNYKDTLSYYMNLANNDNNTVFIGQQILFRGNPMSTTLDGVSKDKMIEVPVMEETQMGMSLGLALNNFRVITFYPRWDFLISAANQLINHLDKYEIMNDNTFKPHVIVRVGKGSDKPLDPGHQHKGNYFDEFRTMSKYITFFDCKSVEDLSEAYDTALNIKGIFVICEYPELYSALTTFNIIPSEDENYDYPYLASCLDISDFKICSIEDIEKHPEEKFFLFAYRNLSYSEFFRHQNDIPVSEKYKILLRNNKNFFILFVQENEHEGDFLFRKLTEIVTEQNLSQNQFCLINGNERIEKLYYDSSPKSTSGFNIATTTKLLKSTVRAMIHSCSEYQIKNNKKYIFNCFNRINKNHRFFILCTLKKYGILENTDWSYLRGYQMKEWLPDEIIPDHYYDTLMDKTEFLNLSDEIKYFFNVNIKKSEYEKNLVFDEPGVGIHWNEMYKNNAHENAYINIVNESEFWYEEVVHVTEKSLTPFYFAQIPLMVATYQHKKIMKSKFDFDFFDDLVDYSYDDEFNSVKRFSMIRNELIRLNGMRKEIELFYKNSHHRFKKNKEKVIEILNRKDEKEFILRLINTKNNV